MRLRKVKKWGDSFVIKLSRDDLRDLNINLGDEVDIDKLLKKEKCKEVEK